MNLFFIRIISFSVRGTHKERFDEDGHGKGKEGRSDEIESTGYVQGFKGK
jgi:hypothetical protein